MNILLRFPVQFLMPDTFVWSPHFTLNTEVFSSSWEKSTNQEYKCLFSHFNLTILFR